MNVVDSSGWLEYFANGRNADFFAPAILDTDELVVPAISIYEVFNRILRDRSERDALSVIAIMSRGLVIPLDMEVSLNAAELSIELKLPMADSIILATARAHNAVLWTQDSDFRGLEGVEYIEA
ncbi:MAG: type II toxin-antitoxin system VapC family toxin [Dehalococcoidia bacterium]|nr:type II toxin-antitoxin system VapC family toxin [Dehalococcoidia bacterium]